MKNYDYSTSLWGISRVINMLLIFRLIHLAPSVKVMHAVVSTAIDIFRSLKPLFGIMASVYYIYALIGIQLFSEKIRPESFDKYNKSYFINNLFKFFKNIIFLRILNEYCGTYKQLSFWANNFNDFYVAFFFKYYSI